MERKDIEEVLELLVGAQKERRNTPLGMRLTRTIVEIRGCLETSLTEQQIGNFPLDLNACPDKDPIFIIGNSSLRRNLSEVDSWLFFVRHGHYERIHRSDSGDGAFALDDGSFQARQDNLQHLKKMRGADE